MREICSYGSVGEPVGNHRLYPEAWNLELEPFSSHHIHEAARPSNQVVRHITVLALQESE